MTPDRYLFDELRAQYGNVDIMPHFLRVDATLDNTTGRYVFDVTKGTSDSVVESKLDRNDLFVGEKIGFFIGHHVTAELARTRLQTYPNKVHFGATSGHTYTDLYALYAGKFSWKTGARVAIEGMDMMRFLKVPQSQEIAAVTISGADNTQAIEATEFNLADSLQTVGVRFTIAGDGSNVLAVDYPNWSGIEIASQDSGTTNKLTMYLQGFLVKGVAR